MIGYGFPEKFARLVMACVTSMRFSIKSNGKSNGFFTWKRGLRQGNPMSLSLICVSHGIPIKNFEDNEHS